MKTIFETIFAAAVLTGVALVSAAAGAPERSEDAAIGAVAGAIGSGRVVSVTGSVVGDTDGPDISRGINFHNRRQYDDRHFDGASDGHRSAVR